MLVSLSRKIKEGLAWKYFSLWADFVAWLLDLLLKLRILKSITLNGLALIIKSLSILKNLDAQLM